VSILVSSSKALRRFTALFGSVLVVAVSVSTLTACAPSWKQARAELIDPVQKLVHRSYPSAIASRERGKVRALFARFSASDEVVAVMQRFGEIDDVRVVIDDAEMSQDRVDAEVTLEIEGILNDGRALYFRQPRRIISVLTGNGWLIESDEGAQSVEIEAPGPRFEDQAAQRGLVFKQKTRQFVDPSGTSRRYVLGSGVAVADVDGNGWDDVALINAQAVELFLNEEGKFKNVSKEWGFGTELDGARTCPVLADFDNDGDPDLFVGAEFGQPLFYRNNGSKFELADVGLKTQGMTIAACSADFNGDGFLDLYLGNHEEPHHRAPQPQGHARNAKPDQLFLNRGDGSFRDATKEAGIDNPGWSLTCATADYDGDGDVDIFVGNDFGGDSMYENDGNAHFSEVTKKVGLNVPVASMSSDWGDYDGDGDFDLFVGGMSSRVDWAIDHPSYDAPVPWPIDTIFRKQVRRQIRGFFHGNRLYENLGSGEFREVSTQTDTVNSGWAWSSVWLDFDNDGLLDVYSANGMISGPLKDDV
jgi:hypothetical protein